MSFFVDNLKLFRLEVMEKIADSKNKEYLYRIDSDFLTAVKFYILCMYILKFFVNNKKKQVNSRTY